MYVVSIKRIRDHTGEQLAEDKQYWEYASYDRYAGSFSTGYPCFSGINHAENFETVEKAKEWWEGFKKYTTNRYEKDYDFSTVAVRKTVYKKVCRLS